MSAIDAFIVERDLYVREHASKCYRPFSYFISKVPFAMHMLRLWRASQLVGVQVLCDLIPLRLLPPLLLTTISYYMIGFRSDFEEQFFNFLLIVCLVSMCSGLDSYLPLSHSFTIVLALALLCLAIGIVSPNTSVANLVAVLALLFQMLFGGFLVNTEGALHAGAHPAALNLTDLNRRHARRVSMAQVSVLLLLRL